MLKTYRIIPLVFILCLFGLTLISVSPVIAEEPWNPSMGMCHNSRPCMIANSCGKQCSQAVRACKGFVHPRGEESCNDRAAQSPEQVSTSPSGGEVAELNAKIAELEAENARLLAMQTAPADPSGDEVAQLRSALDAERQSAKIASKWMQECTHSTRSMLPSANAWRDNVLKFCG
jgi:hypothetical protein